MLNGNQKEMLFDAFTKLVNDKGSNNLKAQIAGLESVNRVSAFKWFEQKVNTDVDTIQITFSDNMEVITGWQPGKRNVDSVSKSKVVFDGSIRDFAGLTMIAKSNNAILCGSEYGNHFQVMLYTA